MIALAVFKSAVFCMADGESKVLAFLTLGVQEYLAACHIPDLYIRSWLKESAVYLLHVELTLTRDLNAA